MNPLFQWGYDEAFYGLAAQRAARILRVERGRFEIVCERGEAFATVRGSALRGEEFLFPTIGDFVEIEYNPLGDSRILRTLRRKTCFVRRRPYSGGQQAVAANFDTIWLLQSMNRDFNPGRLERYLAVARRSGAEPVVVLTKSDLARGREEDFTVAACERVIRVSALEKTGLEALRADLLPGRTVALVGSSGVGKSSLINALLGEDALRTGAVRASDARGRHTTTRREMVLLPGGTAMIDTPGMREMGLIDAQEGVDEVFGDLAALAAQCRFSDCTHGREPGCAIRRALEAGEIDPTRLKRYLRLSKEGKRSR